MKHLLMLGALAAFASPAYAAPCRDAKGHFAKCSTVAAPAIANTKDAKGRCHGAGGKFVKCAAK